MDGISVQSHIEDVDADTTHVLLASNTLLGRPLEGSNARILDFVEILHTLGNIDQQIGAGGVGTETPDLPGVSDIPTELVGHDTGTDLEIVTGGDLARLDGKGELLVDWHGLNEEAIVLVLRLGKSDDGGFGLDGFTVRYDGVGDLERNTSVVVLEILQANLQMELTSTGDNVLTSLVNPCLDTGIGLGETLETFDKLGEIGSILDLDGDLHDGGNGEPHDPHVVGGFRGGKGTALQQELINTDETDDVTGGQSSMGST